MDEPARSGAAISGKRFLPLKGARNVRELGGYLGNDGKTIKWGRLFRAGDLDLLTEPDLDLLSALGLKTIIDFRRSAEMAAAPDKRPSSLVEYIPLSIDPGDIQLLAKESDKLPDQLMVDSYLSMARDFKEQFGAFLNLAAEADKAPLLYHCTAGKDRTGFATALLLSALGVDRKTIMADYILSAEGLGDKYAGFISKHPHLAPLATINPDYLTAALDLIDREYGDMDNYLTNELKADIPRLRDLYLN